MVTIQIAKNELSDGSIAYNVLIGAVELHAVTETDAVALAESMAGDINGRTTNEAIVVYP